MDGDAIRELRKRRNLTQAQMGELLGVTGAEVSRLERGEKTASEQMSARLTEWSGDDDPPAPRLDELPEPQYDPANAPEPPPEDDDPETPKPRRRRKSTPRAKQLSAWQEETAVRLTALVQGERLELDVNGVKHEVVIPGLCALIAAADPFDAAVVGQGAPGLCVALVKVAPRHPWLKGTLDFLAMGGDYNELTRAILAIAIPVAVHHGIIPLQLPIPAPSAINGSGEDVST